MGSVPMPECAPTLTLKERIGGDFFGEHGGGDVIESRAAIFFRDAAAEQADFARLLHQPRHQALFVLFELGDQRDDFLGDEFLGGLADQPLIVGEFGGSEDVFGARRFQQEAAAGRAGFRVSLWSP